MLCTECTVLLDEQWPKKTDLEKYLLLAQEPMNTDVLAWWKLRDHDKAADPSTGRPEGLPHLTRMVRQWLGARRTGHVGWC